MTSSSLRFITLSLCTLLSSACGDETGQTTTPLVPDARSETTTASQAPQAREVELTAEQLAADPKPAAPSNPKPERSETEVSDAHQSEGEGEGVGQGSDAVTELEWDALIPAKWRPDKIMEGYNLDELEDDDPRARELWDKLQTLWKEAPVVEALDGERVKLPGFVVPLDTDGRKTGEFLLVPYYGACIHVPPPPANQTVHVVTDTDREYQGGLFDPVWVSGTLKVESSSSELAEAGYRLEATDVEPYE